MVLSFREVHTIVNSNFQAIHKELEREIRVEELPVDITSNEERWALRWAMRYYFDTCTWADYTSPRLVNMLASLKCMMDDGLTVSADITILAMSYRH